MKLLLDVDGVLCPFGGKHDTPFAEERTYPGYEYNAANYIHFSPRNGERIRQLMDKFEIHWCTGWMNGANDVISPLHGLPEFPTVPLINYNLSAHIHWKFDAIQAYVGDEPYVFIDDDITIDGIDYAMDRNRRGISTLWVPTSPSEGLTDIHVKILEDWYDEVTKIS